MSPEERDAKREAAIVSLAAKWGYTLERAEELIDMLAAAPFGPGKLFVPPAPVKREDEQS